MEPGDWAQVADSLDAMVDVAKGLATRCAEVRDYLIDKGFSPDLAEQMASAIFMSSTVRGERMTVSDTERPTVDAKDVRGLIVALRELRRARADLEERMRPLENAIKDWLGDSEIGTLRWLTGGALYLLVPKAAQSEGVEVRASWPI